MVSIPGTRRCSAHNVEGMGVKMKFKVGNTVRNKITGSEGIVTAVYPNDRPAPINVKFGKYGPHSFSEDALELIDDCASQVKDMHDSGKRQKFGTGAVRDTAEDKPRPALISPYAQMRKGAWLAKGAQKYKERNWEQGMPISRCIDSLERHIQEYKMGLTNEDHLAAVAVNAEFIMHYEAMIEKGLLPAELDDMPKYEQQIADRAETEKSQ